jgi:hypothetical protein
VAGTFTVAAEAGLYRVRLVDDPPPPQTCVSGRSARPAVPVHTLVQEALRKR